jgi:bifunctional DNA-binding transcriptional regulator/antitoxin component of YhaV-PrlF toxin-antitoxin module
MELVKLGKRGQVSFPRAVLRRLGIAGEQTLPVDTTADGSIVLRQAGVYPWRSTARSGCGSSRRPTASPPPRARG